MHLSPLIHDLAVILSLATLVTLIFQKLKQPVVVGYLIAGAIVGPYTPPRLIVDYPNIQVWAELGVIFLMFSLGLEFSFRKLAKAGGSAAITASFEVIFMVFLGFLTGKIMGWSYMDSLFLGALLSISSTTIILKALDELGLKNRRFAHLLFGVLIVEDLAAILLLIALSSWITPSGITFLSMVSSMARLILVVSSWFLVGYFIIPKGIAVLSKVANDEMITICALGFCLLLALFAAKLGYSVALGAFIMGSILAETSESHRIEALIRPIKDVFGAIFFVSVGMLINPSMLWSHKKEILLISLVTIFGKILSTSISSLMSGQNIRTAVQVGFGLAQIGEFSFIIATLGARLKVTSEFLYPIAVSVSVVTTFTTPYLLKYSHSAAKKIESLFPPRVLESLYRYSSWVEERSFSSTSKEKVVPYFFKWFLNGILVSLIWTLFFEYGFRFLKQWVDSAWVVQVLGWAITVVLSGPFIWGMVSAVREFKIQTRKNAIDPFAGAELVFLLQMLTIIWIGILNLGFFPARYIGLFSLVIAGFFFKNFYGSLERSYNWFEKNFLSAFQNPQEKTKQRANELKRLVPWNAHLVRLKVDPDSEISEKKIIDVQLRKRFGLNIVAIQRGSRTLVAPLPQQDILPYDELLVLGTDDQVEQVRHFVEKPHTTVGRSKDISAYVMKRVTLSEGSRFCHKTVRESRVREDYGGMVVGIERGGERILNPNTEFQLMPMDTLWVVGREDRVSQIEEAAKNLSTKNVPADE